MQRHFESDIAKVLYPIWQGICRDDFVVREHPGEMALEIHVEASNNDFPILRGKQQRTEFATGRLITAACERQQIVGNYRLTNNHHGRPTMQHEYRANPHFDEAAFRKMFVALCRAVGLDGQPRYGNSQNGKLYVLVPTTSVAQRGLVTDLSDVLYPFGYTQGQKLDIKPET